MHWVESLHSRFDEEERRAAHRARHARQRAGENVRKGKLLVRSMAHDFVRRSSERLVVAA